MFPPNVCRFCLSPVINGSAYVFINPPLPPVWLVASILADPPNPVDRDDILAARRCVSSPMMTKEHQV